jgi:hypothetical protein
MAMTMPQGLEVESLAEDIKRLLKVGGRLYMAIANETLAKHGRAGEMPIRYGLRYYGHWRGTDMREAHHALGLPIDMKSLITCWDSASVFILKDRADTKPNYKPYDTRFDVHVCPASEAWKEAEFHQWGHVYCDEFHQACASSYHPDGNVVIPENMMKGDDHCHFQWIMPPDAQRLELGAPSELGKRLARDYQATSDVEGAWQALKRTNRLVGGRYISHARAIIEKFGDDGRDTVRRGLRSWGRLRGEHLRKEHEAKGIARDALGFMRRHDMPFATVWDMHEKVATENEFVAEIRETPHDEAWRDMRATELGPLWYEESYAAMAEAYSPGATARWTRLMCRGDAVSEIHVKF